jgi:hypothetical protein
MSVIALIQGAASTVFHGVPVHGSRALQSEWEPKAGTKRFGEGLLLCLS